MIHLRLVVPPEATLDITAYLEQEPRVTHVVLLPGAAISPRGDAITLDVAREAASDVMARLRRLGADDADERVGIAIEQVDAAPSLSADRAEDAAPGSPDDGIVWDLVLSQSAAEARGSWAFYAFLTLATVIAAVAVITDSPILVVGAMVVGPEFGPIAAIAVAIALRRAALAGRAIALLARGFATAIVITALLALLARGVGWIEPGDVTRPRPLTGFIWAPDRWSFVVALLAGCAGVLSLTAGRTAVLVGVFISVTTVPAVGDFALSLALGVPAEMRGSAAQLAVNLVGLVTAGTLTLIVQRRLTGTHPPAPSQTGV